MIQSVPFRATVYFVIACVLTFAFSALPHIRVLTTDLSLILPGFGPLLSGLICYKIFGLTNEHEITFQGTRPVISYAVLGLAIALPLVIDHSIWQARLVSLVAQLVYCLGEEFGWRHYLQNVAVELPKWGAALLTGTVWFFWHYALLPNPTLTLLGQILPLPVGTLACIVLLSLFSLMLGDLVIKTKSVLLAGVAHAVTKFNDPVTMGIVLVFLLVLQIAWKYIAPESGADDQPTS